MLGTRALLFPGQGAQFVGMGHDLFDRDPAARAVFEAADEALGFSLSELSFHGPAEMLTETRIAQPALLTHSVAVLRSLEAAGEFPFSAAAGHSLGEWSALVAAGSIDFIDAVRLVHLRGRLMQSAVPVGEGAMVVIVGLDEETVRAVCDRVGDRGVAVPAAFDGDGRVTVSGDATAVAHAASLAAEVGAVAVRPVDVSAPFHSPLMESTRGPLAAALDLVDIRPPAVPVCSAVDVSWPTEPSEIRTLLVDQLVRPVRWEDCVRAVTDAGIDALAVLGAGASLARSVQRLGLQAVVEAFGGEAPLN